MAINLVSFISVFDGGSRGVAGVSISGTNSRGKGTGDRGGGDVTGAAGRRFNAATRAGNRAAGLKPGRQGSTVETAARARAGAANIRAAASRQATRSNNPLRTAPKGAQYGRGGVYP